MTTLPLTITTAFGSLSNATGAMLDANLTTIYQAVNGLGNGSVALSNINITGGNVTANITGTVALSTISNVLPTLVSLNNNMFFFDGPSVAQGTSGTWYASGTVTLQDTAGVAGFVAKLWDGVTVMASTVCVDTAANSPVSIALSGYLSTPAGNIKISVRDNSSNSGQILANATGVGADSTLYAFRIG